ncbi:tetratricopeptide repeat protein [Mariniflexile gromovii]|uniref:Tetratricopeptide repeat protein n=1 Tax=Mariniflexile gromovii TaxID=362523 RepID=A0ABS4BRW6_9FLAO|nr:T9SS type A sorting domain-containing protein [Mariniflexile gromovii]MBP0903332.1 tetratricopeptide repeat protein [Mariniflexile gromovii]
MKNFFLINLFLIPICLFSQDDEDVIKRVFFKDSVLAMERWYGNDKKLDSLKTYYKSGELNEEFHYINGFYDGMSYKFNKKGEKLTSWKFNKGKLIERIDHIIEFNKKNEEKVKKAHSDLKILNEKLLQKPNDFKSIFTRANIRAYLGDNTLALNDFKKIEKTILKISKTKKVPEKMLGNIYDNLASIYEGYEMENYCIQYKFKALKASPKESRLYHNLGGYLVSVKSYRLGIEYLNKAIEMVPNHSFANWVLAMAYTDLGNYEKAMNHINIAFKNEASLYKNGKGTAERDLWTTRGFLYHKLGETNKGITDLEEALNINKDNSFALRNLGVVYYDLGNYTKACELLQKAKTLGYEKTYDRDDLQAYLDFSCDFVATETKSKTEFVKSTSLINKSFVYPNPTKDIVNIKNLSFETYNYAIFDHTGKLLAEGNSNKEKTISVHNLPIGVYILKVYDTVAIETFRIIKE